MDPYLEHPALWPDVHNRLIAELGRNLGPLVRPRYVVCIEERTYLDPEGLALVSRPDLSVHATTPPTGPRGSGTGATGGLRTIEVHLPVPDRARETYLEVRGVGTGDVVTVVEILSPANKSHGKGRRVYETKRRLVLDSATHLVELDLLRGGSPMALGNVAPADYRILLSRSERRPKADLLLFAVRDQLPVFELPLRAGDVGPMVDLRLALDGIYDTAGYDLRVDYRAETVPPLAALDRAWADALVRAR
jgi:hypothetical protein